MKLLGKEIWLPSDYYKSLNTPSEKAHFWSVTISCFTIAFSLWIGISLQLMVIDSNKNQSDRLAHMEFVDKLYPVYKEYNDSCRALYEDDIMKIREYKMYSKLDSIMTVLNWIAKLPDIYNASYRSVEISSRVQYYFSDSTHKKICKNNARILLALRMIELYSSSITTKSEFFESLKELAYSNKFGFYTLASYDIRPLDDNKAYKRLDSLTTAFWPLCQKYRKEQSPAIYFTLIFVNEIEPYLQSNAKEISEEMESITYHKPTTPIYFIIGSFFCMIIIGFIVWAIIIQIAFNRFRNRPNIFSYEDYTIQKEKVEKMKIEKTKLTILMKRLIVEGYQYKESNLDMCERIESSKKDLHDLLNIKNDLLL